MVYLNIDQDNISFQAFYTVYLKETAMDPETLTATRRLRLSPRLRFSQYHVVLSFSHQTYDNLRRHHLEKRHAAAGREGGVWF